MRDDLEGKTSHFFTLPVIQHDMGEEKRVTFRADPDKIDTLDKKIMHAKIEDQLSDEVSRSDLLRQCVDDLIEEFEAEEGNSNQMTLT